ncbi:MAG: AraC family transcriptional regulator [Pseudomonadota bacterium]
MRDQTTQSYHRRVTRTLEYIAANLDAELSTRQLADIAHLSPWHFHRVFRAITGATLGDVTRTMRLERSASVLRNSKLPIGQIALDCGYESGEALSRAFRRQFGVPPSQYRRLPTATGLVSPGPRIRFNPDNSEVALKPIASEYSMNIRIEEIPAREYYYIENIGPYQNLARVFESLVAWGVSAGIDLGTADIFSQSYDSPRATPENELRSKACISTSDRVEPTGNIKIGYREKRRCAIYTHKGHYDGIQNAYLGMLESFIAQSDEELADAPFVEIFLNDCTSLPSEEWLTDLCIPLQD